MIICLINEKELPFCLRTIFKSSCAEGQTTFLAAAASDDAPNQTRVVDLNTHIKNNREFKDLMKNGIVSSLIFGLALVCGSVEVWAQAPAVSYRKVKAASPVVTLGKFALSTTPNAHVPVGEPGSTGDRSTYDGASDTSFSS
jgi:hypothetical protein